jgi:hypothetical protein
VKVFVCLPCSWVGFEVGLVAVVCRTSPGAILDALVTIVNREGFVAFAGPIEVRVAKGDIPACYGDMLLRDTLPTFPVVDGSKRVDIRRDVRVRLRVSRVSFVGPPDDGDGRLASGATGVWCTGSLLSVGRSRGQPGDESVYLGVLEKADRAELKRPTRRHAGGGGHGPYMPPPPMGDRVYLPPRGG